MERGILEAIDVAHADGRLRREAVGWARHPIQRCHLAPAVRRRHAWNYWSVMDRASSLSVLVADVRVVGLAIVSFQDHAARGPIERVYVRPLGLPVALPPSPRGDVVIEAPRLRLAMRAAGPEGHDLRIAGEARTVLGDTLVFDVTVERPPAHETVNVLVPWDDTHYQFTSKQQALRARGRVIANGREHRFGADRDAFACLDFGRGRWPSRVEWRWAFGAGRSGGRTIGVNLGGKWTDGTGVTENGFVVDGRVHKVSEDVDFVFDARDVMRPWTLRTRQSKRVALRFTPMRARAVRVPLGVASARLDQCTGAFSGTLVADSGEVLEVTDVMGQAEAFRGRW